jgi:hypothetical protein
MEHAGDDNAQWARFQRSRFSWFSLRGKLTRSALNEDDKHYGGGVRADRPATDHDLQDKVGKADVAGEGQLQGSNKQPEKSGESSESYNVQPRTTSTRIAERPADFWNNYETDIQLAAGLGMPACYSAAGSQLTSKILGFHVACLTTMLLLMSYHSSTFASSFTLSICAWLDGLVMLCCVSAMSVVSIAM